jgi:hypothetical protein
MRREVRHSARHRASWWQCSRHESRSGGPIGPLAGYQRTTNGTGTPITTFSGTLNVPTVTCPATGNLPLVANIALGDGNGHAAEFQWSQTCANGGVIVSEALVYFEGPGGVMLASGTTFISPGDKIAYSMSTKAVNNTITLKLTNTNTGCVSVP